MNDYKKLLGHNNPLELSEVDAARLNSLACGGVIDITLRDRRSGKPKIKSVYARRARQDESSCPSCALRTKPKGIEPLCPYFKTCFASMREDKTSVFFDEYHLYR